MAVTGVGSSCLSSGVVLGGLALGLGYGLDGCGVGFRGTNEAAPDFKDFTQFLMKVW